MQVAAYWLAMENYPLDRVIDVIREAIINYEKLPVPAELRQDCNNHGYSERDRVPEALRDEPQAYAGGCGDAYRAAMKAKEAGVKNIGVVVEEVLRRYEDKENKRG